MRPRRDATPSGNGAPRPGPAASPVVAAAQRPRRASLERHNGTDDSKAITLNSSHARRVLPLRSSSSPALSASSCCAAAANSTRACGADAACSSSASSTS